MGEEITVTVDDELNKHLAYLVEVQGFQDKGQAVRHILKNNLQNNFPKKAIILCGGKGTRFRPITYEIPKSLLPIHGKPLVEYLIDLFKKHGVTDILLTVGYLKERVREYFGDGSKFGVKISYFEEDIPMGTAGALQYVKDFINNEPFFVSNGDELKDVNLKEMFDVHKRNNAKATLALTHMEDVTKYGVADLDGERIKRFVEKPKQEDAPSNFINSGLYLLSPEVVSMVNKEFVMFEIDILPKIAEEGKMFAHCFKGQWFDTGNPERYEHAIKNWKGFS